MNEEEYRAEMAKQARLANLIALRRLCVESASVSSRIDSPGLVDEIMTLAFLR